MNHNFVTCHIILCLPRANTLNNWNTKTKWIVWSPFCMHRIKQWVIKIGIKNIYNNQKKNLRLVEVICKSQCKLDWRCDNKSRTPPNDPWFESVRVNPVESCCLRVLLSCLVSGCNGVGLFDLFNTWRTKSATSESNLDDSVCWRLYGIATVYGSWFTSAAWHWCCFSFLFFLEGCYELFDLKKSNNKKYTNVNSKKKKKKTP